MIRMIRSSVLALALTGLVAPAAFAAPRPVPVPASGFAAVWEWVISAFFPVMPVSKAPERGIIEKAGSIMDPNGTPHLDTFSGGSTTDAGSHMDPNGLN